MEEELNEIHRLISKASFHVLLMILKRKVRKDLMWTTYDSLSKALQLLEKLGDSNARNEDRS